MSTPDNIRVIKFRVWHVDHWVDDPRIEIGWLHPEPGVCRLAGFGREIEMFTGLTDRNGRDIYEGDIVRYPRDTPGVADDRFYISVVEYQVESDRLLSRFLVGGDYTTNDDIVVIGNIHENPELLTSNPSFSS